MPKALVRRIVAQCAVIVLDGLSIFLLIDSAKASEFIGTDDIRIPLNGFRTVILCAAIVFKIEFGYPTEEPRLMEPRLLTDSLIKILDRQDVVLVIERRAPYHHQTIGIELGKSDKRQKDQKIKNATHFYLLTGFVL